MREFLNLQVRERGERERLKTELLKEKKEREEKRREKKRGEREDRNLMNMISSVLLDMKHRSRVIILSFSVAKWKQG